MAKNLTSTTEASFHQEGFNEPECPVISSAFQQGVDVPFGSTLLPNGLLVQEAAHAFDEPFRLALR